jgi:hypothetical protein
MEMKMSRLNGDKSRFHRIRKANSLRRMKARELREQLTLLKPVAKGAIAPLDAGKQD